MPGRLDAAYINEHSERQVPVMIHRAILGSMERFIGILIEQHAGSLPLWLAPEQVVVANITDAQADFANQVVENLTQAGFRARTDLRNEKIGYKIRELSMQRIPYVVVLGDREVETNQVAVRARDGADLGSMSIDAFLELLRNEASRP